eukprot:scaffold134349_cov19-Tisochrysis_lutea.AAC.1
MARLMVKAGLHSMTSCRHAPSFCMLHVRRQTGACNVQQGTNQLHHWVCRVLEGGLAIGGASKSSMCSMIKE